MSGVDLRKDPCPKCSYDWTPGRSLYVHKVEYTVLEVQTVEDPATSSTKLKVTDCLQLTCGACGFQTRIDCDDARSSNRHQPQSKPYILGPTIPRQTI